VNFFERLFHRFILSSLTKAILFQVLTAGSRLKDDGVTQRPLIIPSIEIRIIQRAILQVLLRQPVVKEKYLDNPYSFGGIENKGPPQAIDKILELAKKGNTYFIKYDIESFFINIPFKVVLDRLREDLNYVNFIELIRKVTVLEIDNIKQNDLQEHLEWFVFEERGVPQGSGLSPLIANVLLYDFDMKMNCDQYNCVRYLDDFVILTKGQGLSRKQRDQAIEILNKYDLKLKASKTDEGYLTKKTLTFLGIEIDTKNNLLSPSKKNIKKFMGDISKILSNRSDCDLPITFFSKIELINKKIIGWGNTFRHVCNNWQKFKDIDRKVFKQVVKYLSGFFHKGLVEKYKNSDKWQLFRDKLGLKTTIDEYTIGFINANRASKYIQPSHMYIFPYKGQIKYKLRDQNGKVKEEFIQLNGNSLQMRSRIYADLENQKNASTIINKIINDTDRLSKIVKTKKQKEDFKEALRTLFNI
jgi:hypothetical protein